MEIMRGEIEDMGPVNASKPITFPAPRVTKGVLTHCFATVAKRNRRQHSSSDATQGQTYNDAVESENAVQKHEQHGSGTRVVARSGGSERLIMTDQGGHMKPDSNESIRIAGYGACMIKGFPHPEGSSFFAHFLRLLDHAENIPVESEIFSFGGFPIERAGKFVRRVTNYSPHIAILQFGSTNLTVSLNKHFLPRRFRNISVMGGGDKNAPMSLDGFQSTKGRQLIELVKFQLCRMMRIQPDYGGTSEYINSMRDICSRLSSASITPIILSPFPHGDRVSDYWSRNYSDALAEYSEVNRFCFIDACSELRSVPKEKLLLSDKLHLSTLGHRLLGELIFERVRPIVVSTYEAMLHSSRPDVCCSLEENAIECVGS